MTIRKTLTNIVLGTSLLINAVACSYVTDSKYSYQGKLGDERIKFERQRVFLGNNDNILTVTRPDGRIIDYVDNSGDDLILESVKITKNGQTTEYNEETGRCVLEKAQRQFDDYLVRIEKANIKKGLEDLK